MKITYRRQFTVKTLEDRRNFSLSSLQDKHFEIKARASRFALSLPSMARSVNQSLISSTSEILNSEDSSKRVHFENNASSASPSTKSRIGLLASLKNTYSSKLEQSPVKSGSGILTKLHEKLSGTRSSPDPVGPPPVGPVGGGSTGALANLDVPKLRDLKSHSFPPPFSSDKKENVAPSVEPITADLTDTSDSTPSQDFEDTPDDRRRRWLLTSSSLVVNTG